MQKIREWMEANPDGAKELRRQNRSYIFFREVQLSDKDEAVGAQGVPLTPGRSIAVDKSLHVYGTPFFIEGELPIDSEASKTPFRRLMIAQDTGSAIVGPARADLYFGAGAEAGKVSGRLRHTMRFVMLVPKSLDPQARGRKMPLPDERPSEKIAKLFPQVDPRKDQKTATKPAEVSAATTAKDAANPARIVCQGRGRLPRQPVATPVAAAPVPLPEARPNIEPVAKCGGLGISAAITVADETHRSDSGSGAAAQARPERGRARAVGKRCETDQAAAQTSSCRQGACAPPEAEARSPRSPPFSQNQRP